MRILLVGEYSNVHWTLAQGLRQLGHEVTVISDGDGWKNYHRDIDLKRKSTKLWDSINYYIKAWNIISKQRNYDVVQLINPLFIDLRASKIIPFYKKLRKNNKSMFLMAAGMDHYWVKTCLDCKTFRYSDFNIGTTQRTEESFNQAFIKDWLNGEKAQPNVEIAKDCDGIVSGLYEYDCCYRPYFPNKTTFIPFPINCESVKPVRFHKIGEPIRFFIGIQKARSEYKGTHIMLKALEQLKQKYPSKCEIVKVESVPYEEYIKLMDSCHVILDQLYSYTPAMNALIAMAKGLIVVGGGEQENYDILNENELRPIINVQPNEEDVFNQLEQLINNPSNVSVLQQDSIKYIQKHHDYTKIAQKYIDTWKSAKAN